MTLFSKAQALPGIQWFFFIFCNTVVIPPTLQSAFQLSDSTTLCLMQYSFIATGLACVAQAAFGHQRAIMEGPTGLWWGVILTVTLAEAAQGTPLQVIGGSLVVGIALSGVITVVIGVSGLGHRIAALFRPAVMMVFMFLLCAQLLSLFIKGMLGLPFGVPQGSVNIDFPVFLLALAVAALVVGIVVWLPSPWNKYGLLAGTLFGWAVYSVIFPHDINVSTLTNWQWFPLGTPHALRGGIILTAALTGLLNISNTFGALRGTEIFYPLQKPQYRRSFVVSGLFTLGSALLGIVPFSPFVSSVGLLTQTNDSRKAPFMLGALAVVAIGLFTPLTTFFARIPLSISSAVLLVSYLPLLNSSLSFLPHITLGSRTIYRIAIPLFTGIFLMGLPAGYLQQVPLWLRPLLSNGLLTGVMLTIVLENLLPWDRVP
ncbi:uracil/xanthine transporter [Rahnella sp. SL6]|uniref:uracil/xanthine transporter n=1 Tax=Rahnella perminowiae TaxID=2816244 RepID=UPI001C265574|nr:uracil/xanthine transporter [Rahnella perminowiae]MBU9810916.1 uracil/xanthine transporter [Rahnella perminowiae]